VPEGMTMAAAGAMDGDATARGDGDVTSVRSWVGSMRSVSMGSTDMGLGWFRKEQVNEGESEWPRTTCHLP
jgi:hypothetical protein